MGIWLLRANRPDQIDMREPTNGHERGWANLNLLDFALETCEANLQPPPKHRKNTILKSIHIIMTPEKNMGDNMAYDLWFIYFIFYIFIIEVLGIRSCLIFLYFTYFMFMIYDLQ